MSASRERKKRMELAAEGKSPKQLRQAAEKKAKKRRTAISVICIALVLAIGLGLLYGFVIHPNTAPRRAVALRTGSHELNAVDYGYYYYDAINSFYQNYGSYISYFMSDPSKPIDQQVYNEETGETWADYFMQSASESAKYDYAVYDAAVADGYKLSAEGEQQIQDGMKTLEESVKSNGYKSLNDYFKKAYSQGSGKDSYLAYQRLRQTVSEYAKKIDDERTYSDEAIQAKDDENPGKYSNVTYRAYYLSSANYMPEHEHSDDEEDEEAQAEDEAAHAEAFKKAKADADKMATASKGDEEKYIEMTRELATEGAKATYENRDATLNSNVSYEDAHSLFVDWLFDAARKAGDVTVVEDGDSGAYVLYYLSTDDNNYNTVNVRHILIAPENDEDSDEDGTNDTASEAADAAANPTPRTPPPRKRRRRSWPTGRPATPPRTALRLWLPRTPPTAPRAACTRTSTTIRWSPSSTTGSSIPPARPATPTSSRPPTATISFTSSVRARTIAARRSSTISSPPTTTPGPPR